MPFLLTDHKRKHSGNTTGFGLEELYPAWSLMEKTEIMLNYERMLIHASTCKHICLSCCSEDVKTFSCLFLKTPLRKPPTLDSVIAASYIKHYVHFRLFLNDHIKSAR